MREMLDVVNGFPLPLQAAWVGWLAWGAVQVVWYRRGRVAVVRQLPAPRPRPRRPPKPVEPPLDAADAAAVAAVVAEIAGSAGSAVDSPAA